jgi:hypothetical protein
MKPACPTYTREKIHPTLDLYKYTPSYKAPPNANRVQFDPRISEDIEYDQESTVHELGKAIRAKIQARRPTPRSDVKPSAQ